MRAFTSTIRHHTLKKNHTTSFLFSKRIGKESIRTFSKNVILNNQIPPPTEEQVRHLYDLVMNKIVWEKANRNIVHEDLKMENQFSKLDLKLLITNTSLFADLFSFTQDLLTFDRYNLVQNREELKEVNISSLIQYSQFFAHLLKGIVQGWYSFKDLKPYFPNPLTGVQIDGKDLVENDPVTYLYCLWELNSKDFVNEQVPFTREKLICLIPIIFSALDQNDPVTALQYMKLFVKHYPKVKQLYITSAQGSDEFSLESSWTKVLGKVYTENEFDSCLDWETELPVNLNGMYNIFKTHADHQTIEDQWKVLSVIEEEEKKTPSNPYILVFKGYFGDSAKDFIYGSKCLELLAKSPAKVEILKRTEKFNVFKNEQPSNLEIIKDFKFFPLLFWKCVVLSKQEDPRMAVELFKQVEYYSKKQTHFPLLLLKMTLEFRFANDEEVLRIFQLMEPFESQTNLVLLVSATNYACMSMKNLGLEQEIVPMLEKFIEKYGKESNFTTILNYYKK
ncbi:predicted protein [Naegleria gruberi]|uniref:Predicted protein n=1 Tax=Naegleria gruberi TaxID=5762 RepID=D2W4E7_NAEGR|nr:uncharacterized protein NAEGRDRAFT_82311 [Naegleria gruberi]EFC36050.1 predicted protein [Naegleria gruberi]|eukprot:XP_002668794.1 predicted protein [Naegleria gruberi strain NEG-M]